MQKLLIIDGHNLLFQMFFGMPSHILNKDGKAIQGTLGFIGAFLKIIKMISPTHVVVLFDGEHENKRTKINSEYKSNRVDYSETPDEETPFSQLPDIYSALDYLGILHTETVDCETDDVISSYAIKHGNDMQIVISSFDSDFFQLITSNVSLLRYRGEKTIICDEEYIQNKFGILPKQYADFKSLTGDVSDNIKGAKKVGIKTAAILLKEFGSLVQLLENAEKIEKPSIRTSIIEDKERLKQNYKLIKLDNSAQIPFELDSILYLNKNVTTTTVLQAIGLK